MNALVATDDARQRARELLKHLDLRAKIGQLVQVNAEQGDQDSGRLREQVCNGEVGSVINEVDPDSITELQRLAREESPHGIPLLLGRDVIHGFKTVLPIPLAMAATWNDSLVREGARLAAEEATEQGVNWTFSPMIDISRDPRWGRIAESFGEDPYLTGRMAVAMVQGYQGNPARPMMSCLKHFAGYGASESGRDYNTTNIPEIELHNVYFPPFEQGVRAGALSVMTSFSDLNGLPATGNAWLLRDILRTDMAFEGLVVSDWESITQLCVHGVAEDHRHAALIAARAGVDMDMVSGAYSEHLESLLNSGEVSMAEVDELVLNVLTVKFRLGLFDASQREYRHSQPTPESLNLARRMASESMVLLRNDEGLLPLNIEQCGLIALIGPLADQPYEQLGTWIFDGDETGSVSVREALGQRLGSRLAYTPGLEHSRDRDTGGFQEAVALAESADLVVLALGEEAILSGEAHCRADIGLPGAQTGLVEAVAKAGKPVVAIVLAGRPLVLEALEAHADALFVAWHPGHGTGTAFADLLFGDVAPSARLPVTLPRAAGQIPIYYAQGNTGKPATPETIIHLDDIDARAPQTSVGNTSFHLDVDPSPAYPFGFGLTYTHFEYGELRIEQQMNTVDDRLVVAIDVTNTGTRSGIETVQLYSRDLVASVTRPVRELKGYRQVSLEPGETEAVQFSLSADDLAFFDGRSRVTEPGQIRIWIGPDATVQSSLVTRILQG